MEIVSVINYKGGVGKTTVTANLAAELAWRGKKILLLDMDAQASLTFSFVKPDDWESKYESSKTIKSWFDQIIKGTPKPELYNFIIRPTKVNEYLKKRGKNGCIDLICSHLGLINVDLELATLLSSASMTQAKANYLKVHGQLSQAIVSLKKENDYDIVLIDCPPNFNIVTKNAILASQKILIPAKPDYLSTLGIDYLMRSVKNLVKDFNDYAETDNQNYGTSPKIIGVVFTMIQIINGSPIAAQQQYISQKKRLGIPIFDNYFRNNSSLFADAPQNLFPAVLIQHSSGTFADIIYEIKQFVDEFELSLI